MSGGQEFSIRMNQVLSILSQSSYPGSRFYFTESEMKLREISRNFSNPMID